MSVAKNYAKSLFSTSPSAEKRNELASFWDAASSVRAMQTALTAPLTSVVEKTAIVGDLVSRLKISKAVANFLELLAQNGRLGLLPEIIDALDEVRINADGGVLGRIISAEPLEPAAIREITDAFSQKLKKKVEFKVSTDSNLLAGLKVTVNGITYDGTLLSQLDKLRESFVHSAGNVR